MNLTLKRIINLHPETSGIDVKSRYIVVYRKVSLLRRLRRYLKRITKLL